ncbi:conserved hypothetical protein [Flavobacterium sp. 9AF]|uniref:S41 family peptidase n=1 Tax=Flavobacterium sp. 9AF TaxID=2653142 RepID=UPI0012F36A25|nr:S41 family peptidase [Flavobacterium sp. 9AF]VXC33444.1 conserved hypothetical protein [Flavobacterium sp. 9AF]
MKNKIIISFALFTFLLSCKNNSSPSLSPTAKGYIDEVIVLLEKNCVNKNKIDWKQFKTKIYSKAKNAKEIEDTYPSIFLAIKELNDKHSYFEPIKNSNLEDALNPLPTFKDEIVPHDIGYIRVPFFIGSDEDSKDYMHSLLEKMEKENQKNPKGWIVDLRENFGGNMWPMLVCIEPILGNGIVGYFQDSNSHYQSWKLLNGKAYLNDTIVQTLQKELILLKDKNPFVAVLINNKTASSGEAIAVAFKGREKTRFFGNNTFGVSTGCKSYTLSDGSRINLAISTFIDRNKKIYGTTITPDEKCNEKETIEKAIQWIYLMETNSKQIIH